MNEVFRLLGVGKKGNQSHPTLCDFNIEIYKGETVFLLNTSDDTLKVLESFFYGSEGLDEGRCFILGENAPLRRDDSGLWNKIYYAQRGFNIVNSMTLAENIEIIAPWKRLVRYYNPTDCNKRIQPILNQSGLSYDAGLRAGEISHLDKMLLSLGRAVYRGAVLFVLNCREISTDASSIEQLRQVMIQLKKTGLSFLILSDKPNIFLQDADRLVTMKNGRDQMEWGKSFDLMEVLTDGQTGRDKAEPLFLGFADQKWEMGQNPDAFISSFRKHNPGCREIVDHYLEQGRQRDSRGIFIPRDSGQRLHENMTVKESVILCARKRVGKGFLGYISPDIEKRAVQDFYTNAEIDPSKTEIVQLRNVERKILSIYRWELVRPAYLMLESPFWSIELTETPFLLKYLRRLSQNNVPVILYAKSVQEIKDYCHIVFLCDGSLDAQICQNHKK